MAQTTRTPPTPPPTHVGPTPTPHPTAAPAPIAPAVPRMPMQPMMPPMVTDRNLLDQLRQIYQTANRHLPVPADNKLNKQLEDTLEEIAEMAQKAVTDYKPE